MMFSEPQQRSTTAMNKTRSRWMSLLVLSLSLLMAACGSARPFGTMGGFERGFGQEFASNGEQIYFTATSQRGTPITFDMHDGRMMGRMPMMRGGMMGGGIMSCADCHGSDGSGGRVRMMMTTYTAPDIRWASLTAVDHGHEVTEDDHSDDEMDHPPYTEETLKRAIIQGIDPAGEPLAWPMPRWNMIDEDLNDLIDFLKMLE
jgi:cytochrome c oxidase subunit II